MKSPPGAAAGLLSLLAFTGCSALIGADFDHAAATTDAGDVADAVTDGTVADGSREAAVDCGACDAAPPTCGGPGESCCPNSACSGGLACVAATCTPKVLLVGGYGGPSKTEFLPDACGAFLGSEFFLFGGYGSPDAGGGLLGDTWMWNGSSWTNVTPAGPSPSPRVGAGMVVHAGKLVLYGGGDGTGTFAVGTIGTTAFDDTWEWDGASLSWSKTGAIGPGGRAYPGMATLSGEVVLFGGYDRNGNVTGDTWQWNGRVWTQSHPSVNPPSRVSPVMVAR